MKSSQKATNHYNADDAQDSPGGARLRTWMMRRSRCAVLWLAADPPCSGLIEEPQDRALEARVRLLRSTKVLVSEPGEGFVFLAPETGR